VPGAVFRWPVSAISGPQLSSAAIATAFSEIVENLETAFKAVVAVE
jgi:hypothetical protein